jgi:hypothetical protein
MPTITPDDCANDLFRWGREYNRTTAGAERCTDWYRRIKRSHDEDHPLGRVFQWTHRVRKDYEHYASTIPRRKENHATILRLKAERLRPEFTRLSEQWRIETKHFSVISQKVAHPTYFRIIGMGEAAVPLLLETLRDKPSHWFVALQATANVNPVPSGASPSTAREIWLNWGRSQKFID